MPETSATSAVYRNYSNMPNLYITKYNNAKYNNERELFDLGITEVYNKFGVNMIYYITTYDTNYDKIFGEDNNRRFVRKFNFMSYFQLPREEKLWNKFGIDAMDQFSMFVSKRHFKTASAYDYTQTSANTYSPYIPKIGDIVMSDYAKYIYSIVEVKEESGLYLNSKQHIWEFIVKPFKDEKINVPADVSATMPEMTNFANKLTDIYNVKDTIETEKTPINYTPKSNEKSTNTNWW